MGTHCRVVQTFELKILSRILCLEKMASVERVPLWPEGAVPTPGAPTVVYDRVYEPLAED
mgnify:CR=1 FL=1